MLVFVYSSYHLKLSFPHLVVVILTTLKTPKPNSLLMHNKFGCIYLYYIHRTTQLGYAGTTRNLQIVLNSQRIRALIKPSKKNTCQIFLPKKLPELKISNVKDSSIIPVT